MPDFVYSYSDSEKRGMIHTEVEKGFEPRSAPHSAPSWLAAKASLGFELTLLQRQLLNKEGTDV